MSLGAHFRVALHGLAACVCALAWAPSLGAVEEYIVDSSHTVADFEIHYLGIFTQRGKFNRITGVITLDPQAGTGSMEIVIDARSLSTGNERREKFLRGADIFNVDQFPEIRYVAKNITFVDDKPERVHGHLTLLGVTKPVELEVAYYQCAESSNPVQSRCEFGAMTTIHRSEFGMTRLWSFVSDTVKLYVRAEADQAPRPK
jgi:polyisoprenoid-binding protein YceI